MSTDKKRPSRCFFQSPSSSYVHPHTSIESKTLDYLLLYKPIIFMSPLTLTLLPPLQLLSYLP